MLSLLGLVTVAIAAAVGDSSPSNSPLPICKSPTSSVSCVDYPFDFTISPPNLTGSANNSLYSHWRPRSHFIAPEGWMNDPMALWVSDEGLLTAGYQASPNYFQSINISVGMATSKDLFRWKDTASTISPRSPVLTVVPSIPTDVKGVFDGTIIPHGYKGFPTLIYTGINYLPLSWSLPYFPGTESVNLAWTEDGGVTFKKLAANPIIKAPIGYNITGWRDPFVFQSTTFDAYYAANTNTAPGGWYLTVSSGLKNGSSVAVAGPRLLLYKQAAADFTKWDFMGPIFGVPDYDSFSTKWSGNFGVNFETASVVRLNETGIAYDSFDGQEFVTMGTEAGRSAVKQLHWPLWVAGTYTTPASPSPLVPIGLNTSAPQMSPDFVGVTDWGESYAFIDFPAPYPLDSKAGNVREISIGWTYEDELSSLGRERGYAGSLTHFREMSLKVVRNVDESELGRISEPGSWNGRLEADGSTSVISLGIVLAREVYAGLKNSASKWSEAGIHAKPIGYTPFSRQTKTRNYMIEAIISFPTTQPDPASTNPAAYAGFEILRSPDGTESTRIYYDFENENIIVDRSNSSLVEQYNKSPEVAPLRLWNLVTPSGKVNRQPLNIKVVVDNSIVEIYVNDIFALTTRVYPWLTSSTNSGFYFASNSTKVDNRVRFSNVIIHDGTPDAWPARPPNGGSATTLGPGINFGAP